MRWYDSFLWHTCCCCLVPKSCPTLCGSMDCSIPGSSVLHYFPQFTQSHVHWVSDAIKPSHPLSSPSPPAFNLSQQQVFSNESVLHSGGQSIWSFSFSNSPPIEYSRLISFRIDWFDLVVQGTLKRLLQHLNSKASILPHSVSFMVQLSHSYMTTGKTTALSISCTYY